MLNVNTMIVERAFNSPKGALAVNLAIPASLFTVAFLNFSGTFGSIEAAINKVAFPEPTPAPTTQILVPKIEVQNDEITDSPPQSSGVLPKP
jgi:hypothetical protein